MQRPNVLLISIDTLRADHLSCYGYERETTPNIDRLAAAGARFSRAYSTAVWTPPAHGSMLTGLYPSQHGVVDENRLTDSIAPIAETLSGEGYETLGVVNNSQVGELTALHRGHRTFHEVWRGVKAKTFVERGLRALNRKYLELRGANDHGAKQTTDIARQWIEQRGSAETPFYMFLHYIEPHNPILAPEPYRYRFADPRAAKIDRAKVNAVADNPLICYTDPIELTPAENALLEGLYDGEIAYVDSLIGGLMDCLKRSGHYDDTLIILTADHGEHFGEHGMYSHVSSLYEPIVHIPLIVKFPGTDGGPGVCPGLAQLVDIVPTIAHFTGAEPPHAAKLKGRSLNQADAASPGHEFVFAEWEGRIPYFVRKRLIGKDSAAICDRLLAPMTMIRDERYKLIRREDGAEELYDLDGDPQESENLATGHPDVAERLRTTLEQWKAAVSADSPGSSRYQIDPEIQRHLESLGYM
jgi:arylsulfatase A-like enzyme